MDRSITERRDMTVDEFLAFTDERPEGERWELIEGVPVLSPSPTYFHQVITANIVSLLDGVRRSRNASWRPIPGIGTRVPASPRSLPQPDVMVMRNSAGYSPVAEEATVLFEVLSKSNTRTDQAWRKRAYTSIESCQHYVVVDQYRALVIRYDRASDWRKIELTSLAAELELSALQARLSLSDIYDGVDFTIQRTTKRTPKQ